MLLFCSLFQLDCSKAYLFISNSTCSINSATSTPRDSRVDQNYLFFSFSLSSKGSIFSRSKSIRFVVPACHFIDFSQVLEFLILRLLAFLNLRHHTLVLLSNGGTCCLKALPLTLQLAYSLGLINCILGTNVIVLQSYLPVYQHGQTSFSLVLVVPIIFLIVVFQFIEFHLLFTSLVLLHRNRITLINFGNLHPIIYLLIQRGQYFIRFLLDFTYLVQRLPPVWGVIVSLE